MGEGPSKTNRATLKSTVLVRHTKAGQAETGRTNLGWATGETLSPNRKKGRKGEEGGQEGREGGRERERAFNPIIVKTDI